MKKLGKFFRSSLGLYLLLVPFVSYADTIPEQNVIFITFDGVRHNDIYKPEQNYDFLETKKGYPLANFQIWAASHGGFFFGTQKKGDKMLVGNNSARSLPGYLALFSGKYEKKCKKNDGTSQQNETLVDQLQSKIKDSRKIALFSSWDQIQLATQKEVSEVVYSFGPHDLKNFYFLGTQDLANLADFQHIIEKGKSDRPDWSGRKDEHTWKLAAEYIQDYLPRFTYISLLDTDEWAHQDQREEYFIALNDYDKRLMELINALSTEKYKGFLDNTSIVITTDHGRGRKKAKFDRHGKVLGGFVKGSNQVWSIIVPSKTILESFSISKSGGKEGTYSQLDIRPTIEMLMDPSCSPTSNSLIVGNAIDNQPIASNH